MSNHMNGSCLCGSIRFEVLSPPLYAGYCHCSECRKFSGSAFSAMAGVKLGDLRVADPENYLGTYRKTSMSAMKFCRNCGSSLFVEKSGYGLAHVRLGTLDSECPIKPQAHVHVASKASWYEIPQDGLPQFPGAVPQAAAPDVPTAPGKLDEIASPRAAA